MQPHMVADVFRGIITCLVTSSLCRALHADPANLLILPHAVHIPVFPSNLCFAIQFARCLMRRLSASESPSGEDLHVEMGWLMLPQ